MQPFGILEFLKAFLPKNPPENAGATPSFESGNPLPAQEINASDPAPHSPPPPPQPNQAAYQAFVDRHEQAARKLRKK